MTKVLSEFESKHYYDDSLILISHGYSSNSYPIYWKEGENVFTAIEKMKKTAERDNEFSIEIKSELFQRIYSQVKLNWVDIENVYFNKLKQQRQNAEIPELEETNNVFNAIKNLLVGYLDEQRFRGKAYIPIVDSMISSFDINRFDDNQLMLLNFNYTSTVDKYQKACEGFSGLISEVKRVDIHGNLDESNGKPIFGIGDEYDKDYVLFKETTGQRYKELLKNSKSQWYLRTDNYRHLLKFINYQSVSGRNNANDFDVEIYGHSCGSSDRTLLRYIFEHPNCQSIKVYYHEKEEHFFDLMLNLEKIFTDPILFRQKVLSLKSCEPMPQLPKNK